jgi:hypothetical protein
MRETEQERDGRGRRGRKGRGCGNKKMRSVVFRAASVNYPFVRYPL